MSTPDFGIVHRAGCDAPGIAAAMPVATALGRGVIDTVADGKGGELFLCRRCGMVEGQAPAAAQATPIAPVGTTPTQPAARRPPGDLTRDAILEARRAWKAEGQRSTSLRVRLGTTDATLRRARRHHGLSPWPEV